VAGAVEPSAQQSGDSRCPNAGGMVGRLCSDRVTDRWVPHIFRFFQFIQNRLNLIKSKWVPYLAPQIPDSCM
jgi:hypothetical protein